MHTLDPKPRVQQPRLTAILPCKGNAPMVKECLDSLADQTTDQPYEVILVDGWMDEPLAELARGYDFVCLIRSDENLLQAEARNLAAQHANSEYLAFIDSDCVADRGWVAGAIEALNSGVRLAGGPVVDHYPDRLICVADNYSQFAELPATRPAGVQDHFPACNIAVRKDDFFKAGGFPRTGVPAAEDTLFCYSMSDQHGPESLQFRPGMTVAHRGRETLRAFLDHQKFFGSVRGMFGLKLDERKRNLGRYTLMGIPVSLLRARFMLTRTAKWAPRRLWTVLKITPLMVWGMAYFARGFRDACRAPLVEARPAFNPDGTAATAPPPTTHASTEPAPAPTAAPA
ncbi:MAG: glycosyltransferase family A protein [Planctomycetota bacterium]